MKVKMLFTDYKAFVDELGKANEAAGASEKNGKMGIKMLGQDENDKDFIIF